MTATERGRLIWRLGDLVFEHLEELAELETLDNGKPIDAALPFGGYKQSGWGREMGHEVFNLYTQIKSVCLDTVADELNGRPRQTLGWATPGEKMAQLMSVATTG